MPVGRAVSILRGMPESEPATEPAVAHQDDLSGRSLGGYRLLRRLGSGAMADVYLAEQQSLGRQVAVKVLRRETMQHPAAVERFSQEARAAAALVHGNIVQIHEVACVDGIHFLAAEYVSGPSLKAWLLARGPLDPLQALSVLSQVGSALAKSAQAGIVHRDIKPENLLVTPAGEVKVADFGLARAQTQTQAARLREATQHLQAAADQERLELEASRREQSRRAWLVAAAAAAALALGFAIGRRRPQRSELFRSRP